MEKNETRRIIVTVDVQWPVDIRKQLKIEKGDCVQVDDEDLEVQWTGICTWTDGYKFEFLINGEMDVWILSDLEAVRAKVISASR